MDDLLMILGALTIAVGAGLVYIPAGVILLGLFVGFGGYLKARLGRTPPQ